jgi:hypothetical protein
MKRNKSQVLPWPYTAILLAEILGLIVLYGSRKSAPPFQYEFGWIGTGSMLLMQVYSLRRRFRFMWRFGAISHWLSAHIFLGLQGFVFVAYHSIGVNFDHRVAGVNIVLLTVIVATGIFGRYLYGLLPKTHFELNQKLAMVEAETMAPEGSMMRRLSDHRIDRLAQSARVAGYAERWFSHWTLFHRPLSFLFLGVTFLHVLAHFVYAR